MNYSILKLSFSVAAWLAVMSLGGGAVFAQPVRNWLRNADGTWSATVDYAQFRGGVNPFVDLLVGADGSTSSAAVLTQNGKPLNSRLSRKPVVRHKECLINIAGITQGGRVIPGKAAVDRKGLGDAFATKWGTEIGYINEGSYCTYRGLDFSRPEARVLEFHTSSGLQDTCLELYDAHHPECLLGTVYVPMTGHWQTYKTTKYTLGENAVGVKDLKIVFREVRASDVQLSPGEVQFGAGTIRAAFAEDPNVVVPELTNAGKPVEGDEMLVIQRGFFRPSHVYTYHVEGLTKGGGLYVGKAVPGGVLRRLVDASEGVIQDAQVSYDGKSILFSWKRTMSEPFEIWRINVDGTDLKCVVSGPCNNQNACHLPDGGIAFTSDRKPAFAYCWISSSPVLYRCDGDGSKVVRLSANYLTDFTPSVMSDGRILFSRWEYVDRPAIPIQSLWAIQPDGTGLSGVFGNRVLSPATFMYAHDVPGRPGHFLCVMTGHNGPCAGAIGLIDVSRGGNAQSAIQNLTPEVKVAPVEDGIRGNNVRGPYTTPYPVDGERYLVSKAGEVQLRRYDGKNGPQTLLVAASNGMGWYSPQLVRPRSRPAMQRANVRDEKIGPFAELVLQDVRIGLEGHVRPDEVKRIAVIQEMEKDILAGVDKRQFGFQFPVVSCGATYAPKRVWGFADVEKDGSAHFLVPAGKPIYFLPLDAEGRAVQRMRTFTHFMPGERQSCIGCHADRNYVSISPTQIGKSIAAQRPAQRLTPPTWGSDNGFSFARVVQPVLNRHCVKCHSGADGAPEPELTGDRTDYFNVAYENLARKGTGAESGNDVRAYMKNFGKNKYTSWIPTFNGLEENILWITPKFWGSPASLLSKIVASGHPDAQGKPRVQLTDDERLRIHMWIDLDVPYYGTSQSRQNELRGCRRIYPKSLWNAVAAVEKRKGKKLPYQFYVRYDHPERNAWLKEGLAKGIFASVNDPDYQLILKEIEQARPLLDLRNDVDFRDVIGAE